MENEQKQLINEAFDKVKPVLDSLAKHDSGEKIIKPIDLRSYEKTRRTN